MFIFKSSNETKIGSLKLFVPQGEKMISSAVDSSEPVKDKVSKALERSMFSYSLFSE